MIRFAFNVKVMFEKLMYGLKFLSRCQGGILRISANGIIAFHDLLECDRISCWGFGKNFVG